MTIIPKRADDNLDADTEYEAVEFQMLDTNLVRSLEKCRALVRPNHKRVYYHLPLGMHCLSYYTNMSHLEMLNRMTAMLIPDKEKVIAHISIGYDLFRQLGGLAIVQGHRDFLMLENGITPPTEIRYGDDMAWRAAKEFDIPTVCDITHLRATEYLYGITLPVPEGCSYIHFAACLLNDGVRDLKTHGRVHPSYKHLVNDVFYLGEKGIDISKATFCAEVSEDDYVERPDQEQELAWLKQFKQEVYNK